MGRARNKVGNSFGDQWYLEQTLKLRATKFNKQDDKVLTLSKLESLIPILRYSLVVYMFFNTLLLVEDLTYHRSLPPVLIRYFIVTLFLTTTFICTFLPIHRTKYFFILSYLCMLVQMASTSSFLYFSVRGKESSPISPFLPLDTFFVYMFVRMNIATTAAVNVLALAINEVIVIALGDANSLEVANVVLYLVCNVLAVVSGRIFELNLRSKYVLSKEIEKDRASMESEREKAEKLLYNILPREIADSLKNELLGVAQQKNESENAIVADSFDDTTIAFCDICDFTVMSEQMHPEKLVSFLNEVFSSFDILLHEYGLEKIKTIGDAYMFTGGLSKNRFIQTRHGPFTPAEAVAEMALGLQGQVDRISKKLGSNIKVRVGINSGSVVAGIVGISKFVYDLFGETVNLASKMESTGQPQRVHVSQATYEKLAERYDFEPAQDVEVKEKLVQTYFLLGRKEHLKIKGKAHGKNLGKFLGANATEEENIPLPVISIPTNSEHPDQPKNPPTPTALSGPDKINMEVIDVTSAAELIPGFGDAVIFTRPRLEVEGDGAVPKSRGGNRSSQAVKGTSILDMDNRPKSTNGPLHIGGSMEYGASNLEVVIPDITYVAPALGLKDVISFESRTLEIKFRKDYFRKYFRLVQLNSLGGLFIYIILGTLCTVTLPGIDYTVLLVFAIALVLIGVTVGVFFMGDERRMYMHYMPAMQSGVSAVGILVPVIILLMRENDGFEHHTLVWNACIIMLSFMFVFPGLPFIHSMVVAIPIVIANIISVAVVDPGACFGIIVRLLMIFSISVCVGYRKEQESRAAFFVTQTLDDERRQLTAERSKSERLLYSILPQKIAVKLKSSEGSVADTFHDVTVMFVSIHNFTYLTSSLGPFEKVTLLNKIFSKFDKLAEYHKVEKIKTIGPTYLVVGGLPVPRANHIQSIAELAIDMQEAINNFIAPNGERYKIKAGIHSGKVVAGVIGIYKFSYDLWGDTVNTASRMESHSLPGQIQVTEVVQKKLATRFDFNDRGFIQVKGKGIMHTYFLNSSTKPKPISNLPNIPTGGYYFG